MLIAHEGLVTLTEGLCYVLEIAKDISKVLEEAVFGFIPHAPNPAQWSTPNQEKQV